MSYYGRGDYYRGDYYRGDLFGAFKSIGKAVGKVVGTVSKAAGIVTNPIGTGAKIIQTLGGGGPPSPPGGRMAFGPQGVGGPAGPGGGASAGPGVRGYHLNKHALGATKKHGAVPAKSIMVRNRHMNVANVRALRRAAQRARGFIHVSRKLVGYYQAKAPKGRPYIKARRKR